MRHHTTDPFIKACHIADREQRQHELDRAKDGLSAYGDWPKRWLSVYETAVVELTQEPEQD